MFRNLKLKLTFINLAVMAVILLVVFSGIYSMTVRNMFMQSDQMMRIIAGQPDNGGPDHDNERRRRHFNYFYAKILPPGLIMDISSDLPVTEKQLVSLVTSALGKQEPRGTVELNNESYRFLKAPPDIFGQTTIIFVNNEIEESILDHLAITLVLAGLLALALAFFGGMFLAERSLIPIRTSWQRQRDFVADASHELRTPLASMQTNLDLVLGNPEDTVESQNRWLTNIKAEGQRMAKLVDDLLFLARADSDQEMLDMKPFPLHTALKDALQPLEAVAASQEIDFVASIEPEIIFNGDETRIKQLVVILVDNAIKYTPSGGRIEFSLRENDKSLEIIVSDTGEGIEQEHLERVFERFYRIDKARSRYSGGSGLGLSIAQWIVEEHNGTIKVVSHPGRGTTFRVTMPKQQNR